jgi:hypothetical protein
MSYYLTQSGVGATPTPDAAFAAMHGARAATSAGGVLVAAGIMLCAQPFHGQEHGAAAVYEGDHTGGTMRLPDDKAVHPSNNCGGTCIMATNHFQSFKVELDDLLWRTDGAV